MTLSLLEDRQLGGLASQTAAPALRDGVILAVTLPGEVRNGSKQVPDHQKSMKIWRKSSKMAPN